MGTPLPRVCTTQPQFSAAFDASNPLCEGLVYLYNPAIGMPDGGGGIASTIGYLKTKSMGDSVGLDFPGDGGVAGAGPHAIVDTNAMVTQFGTVAILMRSTDVHIDASPNYHDVLVSKGSVSGTLGGFTLRMTGSTAAVPGSLGAQFKNSSNVDVCNFSGTTVINDGKPHLCTLVFSQVSGDFNYFFVDNHYETGQFNSAAWAWDTVTDGVHIGGAQDTFWGYLIGQIFLIAIWNRKLTGNEVNDLAENPWQLFQPPTLWHTEMGSVSVQRIYPNADASAGSWVPSTGTNLYAVIDEPTASDTDFASSSSVGSSPMTLLLETTGAAPGVTTGHVVHYRIRGTGTLLVELLQGGTTIASWTHSPAPSTYTTYDQTLSGAQAAAITNYANLKLRFTPS